MGAELLWGTSAPRNLVPLLSLELDKPEESYSDNSDLKQISNPPTEKTPVLPHILLYIIKVLHTEAKLSHS